MLHALIKSLCVCAGENIAYLYIRSQMVSIIIKIIYFIFRFRLIQPEYLYSLVIIIFLSFFPNVLPSFRIRRIKNAGYYP